MITLTLNGSYLKSIFASPLLRRVDSHWTLLVNLTGPEKWCLDTAIFFWGQKLGTVSPRSLPHSILVSYCRVWALPPSSPSLLSRSNPQSVDKFHSDRSFTLNNYSGTQYQKCSLKFLALLLNSLFHLLSWTCRSLAALRICFLSHLQWWVYWPYKTNNSAAGLTTDVLSKYP